jgi:polar amino acid transport system permease protein
VYQFNLAALAPYMDQFVNGFLLTLLISFATVVISLPLGLGGALVRTSHFRVLRAVTGGYVQFLRNIPLLLVVYLLFYELPLAGIRVDAYVSGIAALSVVSIAYTIEIFRGGLAAIPVGQYEAANSLGLRPVQVFRYVVMPQLVRICFPALGNQVVSITLASSLVFVVGIQELTSVSYNVGSETFRYFESFVIAGAFYVAAVQVLNRVWVVAGRRWFASTDTVRAG